ncbi:transglutaminase domain-containing protein [Paenibacillus sp. MDMC362]|uniref:transglutaminase family protein n=1 Tax=Paenibacillus sp. MDMC362 TaxID=2977365 RepID=UPI000DC45C6B|nr:transglutaminase domain-containing protein [Paenibacillus sp. MDMC362]RAR42824.1 transglutaminase domain-containing protein [Paenibacillus sp. MDMC362]
MSGPGSSPVRDAGHRKAGISGAWGVPPIFVSRLTHGTLLHRILITLPVVGLLSEWLLPLRDAGDMGSHLMLQTLFLWALFLLLQGLFTLRGWVWLPLNAVLVVWLCARLFEYSHPLAWLSDYISETLPGDVSAFGNAWEFTALSQETRTIILLVGWAIMVSAVHMLALYRRTVWLFGGSTLVYLAVLESAMEESIYGDMLRAVLYILLAQGMMLILKLKQETVEGTSFELDIPEPVRSGRLSGLPVLRWSLVVLLASGLMAGITRVGGAISEPSAGVGLTVSEMAARLTGWGGLVWGNREPSIPASQVAGYASQGKDLGGPLTLSDALYFTAQSPEPTYWRGDTYNRYDGRKWEADPSIRKPVKLSEDLSGILPYWERPSGDKLVQTLTFEQDTPIQSVLSGGIITSVKEIHFSKERGTPRLAVDRLSETVSLQGERAVSGYTIETLYSQPEEQSLRSGTNNDPEYMKEMYLQLPEQLPLRVRDLAREITWDAVNRYEKAKAIESYLEQNYTYSLQTSVPPEGRDFTDYFLFDTKEGYCVHFATTMTVLLRSEGIPARYVTGFAPGEPVAGTVDRYEVAQKNAHAWVEVFFPGQGWVLFDPTPGFSIEQVSTPPLVGDSGSAGLKYWNSLWDSMIYGAAKVLFLITAIGPVMFGAALLLVLPILVAVVYQIPTVRQSLAFLRMARTIAVSGREGLVSISVWVWDKLQRRFGDLEKGQTMRQYVNALSIADAEFRAELGQFAQRWERAAYDDEPWSRTEKVLFLRQCIRIVKKLA